MSDGEWLTYTEAAKRLGTTPDAIRQRVKRGQMQGSRGNDGRPRIWADVRFNGQTTEQSPDSPKRTESEQTEHSGRVKALEDHIETLKTQLAEARQERERDRADHAADLERVETRLIQERNRLQDQLQEALAEADHAKADQVRMARDVATMFDKLKGLADRYADLHTDRARLQAEGEQKAKELDRLSAELARAQQPWWRRLFVM
jgi:chromosome segregation ATPase